MDTTTVPATHWDARPDQRAMRNAAVMPSVREVRELEPELRTAHALGLLRQTVDFYLHGKVDRLALEWADTKAHVLTMADDHFADLLAGRTPSRPTCLDDVDLADPVTAAQFHDMFTGEDQDARAEHGWF